MLACGVKPRPSLLQAYGATIAAIEVNVAVHDIKRTSSSKTAKGASHG
jgi:hypothetical protein